MLFAIFENSLRSETEGLGAVQKQADDEAMTNSQDKKALQERQRKVPQDLPTRLYGSLDAAKVRIEPRAKQGEVVPEHEDWRDMKVGCWYQAEPVSKMYQSKRQKVKAERDGTVFRITQHQYFAIFAHRIILASCLGPTAVKIGLIKYQSWLLFAMEQSGFGIWSHTITQMPHKLSIGIMPNTISRNSRILCFLHRKNGEIGWIL